MTGADEKAPHAGAPQETAFPASGAPGGDRRNAISPSLGRCVLAGLLAGQAAAVLANLTAWVLSRELSRSFDQLNLPTITRAAVILCVLSAFVYFALVRWTGRPVLWFALVGLAFAGLDSWLVAVRETEAGFAQMANPLHFVVAATALVLVPLLAPAIPEPEQPRPRTRATPPPLANQR
jgi:hypothetical protein